MTVNQSLGHKKTGRSNTGKKVLIILAGVIVFLGLFGFFAVYKPALKLYADAKVLKDQARMIKDGAATQDLDQLRLGLTTTESTLKVLQTDLQAFGWAKIVPFAASYYGDALHGMTAAQAATDAGIKTVDAIYPHASKIGFKTSKTEAFGSMKEKVAALLTAMPEIAPTLGGVQTDIATINKELSYISSSRYPNKLIKGINPYELINTAKNTASNLATSFPDIEQAFMTLPAAFGADGATKTYLIMFQNDKELRPTGGFWTAYALATFKNGQLVDVTSQDMYALDEQIGLANHPAAPAIFSGFLEDMNHFYARDANISPDFPTSVATFMNFWRQARKSPIDGVWAMDTYVLQELLRDVGKVEVSGYSEPFDENNVIERLETYTNVLLREQAGRKEVLGELMNALMQKTFSASQKQYPVIISSMGAMLSQKHILLTFNDTAVQALVNKYNLSGQIKAYDSDYLHVNDANLGGRKANWYVTEQISKEVAVQGGQLVSKVTINYQNPGKYHPDFNTGYKDLVRVYVPLGSKLLSSSGSLTSVSTGNELGKTYFMASILVKPDGGTATLTFDYTLPDTISSSGDYKLLIQKQPGTGSIPVDLKINGKGQKLVLDTDKEITQKI